MPYSYKRIKLPDGTTRDRHRLIMERKLGRRLTFNEIVHHKNEDKSDDNPDNLELKPRSIHSAMHQRGKPKKPLTMEMKLARSKQTTGSKNPSAILNEECVRRIKGLIGDGLNLHDIAKAFGVSKATIYSIKAGRYWKHVA